MRHPDPGNASTGPDAAERDDAVRVPIVEERAHLTTREVRSGHVRVSTVAESREERVAATLATETLHVERRAVEREVSAAPPPREEDGVTIVSVVEERLVVTKTLFVVEEIVIRRAVATEHVEIPVTLRSTRAIVEREPLTHRPENE